MVSQQDTKHKMETAHFTRKEEKINVKNEHLNRIGVIISTLKASLGWPLEQNGLRTVLG